MKKRLILLLLVLSALLLVVACGDNGENTSNNSNDSNNPNETTIRVAWWGGQERHDMTLEAIELFEELNPDIKVQPEYTGWDGYWERLNTQAAGSNLPDVIAMDLAYLNEYNNNDLVMDLAPLIDDGLIDLSDVDDVYQEMNHDGDQVLAVSLGANAMAVMYNEELLAEHGFDLEPGFTYDDIYEMNLEIKEAVEAEGGEYFGYDFANSEYELFNNFARQHDMTFYNAEGNDLGFEKEVLVTYFEWVQKMVEDGAAPSHDIMMSYIEGANSMIQEGSSAVRTAASNQLIGDQQGTEYELSLSILPALDGVHANFVRPSMSFSLSNQTKHQEAGAKFIDFFTNNLEANEILQAERGVPISSVVREHLSDKVSEPVEKTFEYLEVVAEYSKETDPLSPPGETEVRGAFSRILEALKYSQVTPEEAADRFMDEAIKILN